GGWKKTHQHHVLRWPSPGPALRNLGSVARNPSSDTTDWLVALGATFPPRPQATPNVSGKRPSPPPPFARAAPTPPPPPPRPPLRSARGLPPSTRASASKASGDS